jgi:hypothetical protein
VGVLEEKAGSGGELLEQVKQGGVFLHAGIDLKKDLDEHECLEKAQGGKFSLSENGDEGGEESGLLCYFSGDLADVVVLEIFSLHAVGLEQSVDFPILSRLENINHGQTKVIRTKLIRFYLNNLRCACFQPSVGPKTFLFL